jgi:hypothetical protein
VRHESRCVAVVCAACFLTDELRQVHMPLFAPDRGPFQVRLEMAKS